MKHTNIRKTLTVSLSPHRSSLIGIAVVLGMVALLAIFLATRGQHPDSDYPATHESKQELQQPPDLSVTNHLAESEQVAQGHSPEADTAEVRKDTSHAGTPEDAPPTPGSATIGEFDASPYETGEVVDIEVARVAALDQLPMFFEGKWKFFADFPLFGLDGRPQAYAIAFVRNEAVTRTITELEQAMRSARERIRSLRQSIEEVAAEEGISGSNKNQQIAELEKQLHEAEKELHGRDHFATVVTGALTTWPVVLRAYHGLPLEFVKKAEAVDLAARLHPGREWQVRRFLSLGLFDEVFEMSPAGHGQPEKTSDPASGSIIIVDTRTGKSLTMAQLLEKKQLFEREQNRNRAQNAKIVADEIEMARQNKDTWDRYARLRESQRETEKSTEHN